MLPEREKSPGGDEDRPLRAEYDYVVLGAGVAGLSFAHEVARGGKSVLVLEKDRQIGGLSRTLEYRGFKFDYCAHRFHSGDPELIDHVRELVGPGFRKHAKKSRIFMFGRYLRYPFELQNLLRAMPKSAAIMATLSFAKNWALRKTGILRRQKFENYREWFEFYFGHKLYEVMCRPYTSKIWKMAPSRISADWADERFQGVKVRKLIGTVLRKAVTLNFSSYSIEEDSLAPDGGDFYYGDGGAQDIPDAYARHLATLGGSLVLSGVTVEAIRTASNTVEFEFDGERNEVRALERIISTIPLHACYGLMDRDDDSVVRSLEALRYMDIIFVYLMLDQEQVSNDHWLYFPDGDIIFNRAVEFKNWSQSMCPAGKTALCLDITCFAGDEVWSMTDDELVKKSIDGAVRARLIDPDRVSDTLVVRVRDAYPVYDLDYRGNVASIVDFIEDGVSICCLGRTGVFKYNNSDGSIEMGRDLARSLLAEDSQASARDWRVKQVSY